MRPVCPKCGSANIHCEGKVSTCQRCKWTGRTSNAIQKPANLHSTGHQRTSISPGGYWRQPRHTE